MTDAGIALLMACFRPCFREVAVSSERLPSKGGEDNSAILNLFVSKISNAG